MNVALPLALPAVVAAQTSPGEHALHDGTDTPASGSKAASIGPASAGTQAFARPLPALTE
jgi:hypothetical protein